MTDLSTPQIVVIDTETSGTDETRHIVTEVAWWHLGTNDCGVFVPPHDPAWVLEHGDPRALEISGYRERLADAPQDSGNVEMMRMARALNRQTWCGSNPGFDIRFLLPKFAALGLPREFWHHRPCDIGCYAAGVLGLTHIPGLHELCVKLDIEPPNHSAKADVLAVGRCLLTLLSRP